METLTDSTYQDRISATDAGVCIFLKKLCPHCKNMTKVLEKFSSLQPGVALMSIDIEENTESAQAFEAERAPTVLVVKSGKVVGKKGGLMNPKEMLAFYQSA
jgi:thioredoxin 1